MGAAANAYLEKQYPVFDVLHPFPARISPNHQSISIFAPFVCFWFFTASISIIFVFHIIIDDPRDPSTPFPDFEPTSTAS